MKEPIDLTGVLFTITFFIAIMLIFGILFL